MQPYDVLHILIEFGLVYLFFCLFSYIGNFFLQKFSVAYFSSIISGYGRLFTSFICGLLIVIYFYSVIVSRGLTINLLILPLFYYLFFEKNKKVLIKGAEPLGIKHLPFLEIGMIALLIVVILHLFPESEYKQADSFFYLKIAESLNATGQENINHYFNLYDDSFHGLEPYHYFEIWITAFIIRITEGFYASVNVHRFVTQGVLLTAFIIGMYYLVEGLQKNKIASVKKIFCWSLLFILPNLLVFSSSLYKVFISDFEGNVLERPNFRIIYLLLIPVVLKLYNKHAVKGRITYLLLLLSVVSFMCAVVIIPSIILYNLYSTYISQKKNKKFNWLHLTIFCVLFVLMYLLFPVSKIPAFYGADTADFLARTLLGWKFILYSIAMSLLYVLLLLALFLLPLAILYKKDFYITLKDLANRLQLLILIAVIGLLMARVLYLKDNAYQFLFITHIVATLFIYLMYLLLLSKENKAKLFVISALFLSALWFIKPLLLQEKSVDIFEQNGNYVYGGARYSESYLRDVDQYFSTHKNMVGGYMADTNFYKNTYYSRRNPNVYFLAVTYIVSNKYNRNFEFCLSNPAAIRYQETNVVYSDYLNNAIQRSFIQQYKREIGTENHDEAVNKLISKYNVAYLIVTKDFNPSVEIMTRVKRTIADSTTGERFLILQ